MEKEKRIKIIKEIQEKMTLAQNFNDVKKASEKLKKIKDLQKNNKKIQTLVFYFSTFMIGVVAGYSWAYYHFVVLP